MREVEAVKTAPMAARAAHSIPVQATAIRAGFRSVTDHRRHQLRRRLARRDLPPSGRRRPEITYTGHDMNGPQTVDMMSFPRRFEAQSGSPSTASHRKSTPTKNVLDSNPGRHRADAHRDQRHERDAGGRTGSPAKLIDKITTALPNALLVVAKIIPLNGSVKAYNDAIPGIVQTRVAQGKHILIVDLNTGFPPGDMDAVHLKQSRLRVDG